MRGALRVCARSGCQAAGEGRPRRAGRGAWAPWEARELGGAGRVGPTSTQALAEVLA